MNNNSLINIQNKNGDTALHVACKYNQLRVVKILTEYNCDINIKNIKGYTPLHIALIYNDIEIIKHLLSNNVNVNIKDNEGNTPLHKSIYNVEIVKLIIDCGAYINTRNKEGNTALNIAVDENNINIFKYLLSKNANIYLLNKNGETPLHKCIINNNLMFMKQCLFLDIKIKYILICLELCLKLKRYNMFKLILTKHNHTWCNDVLYIVSKYDDIDMFKYLIDNGCVADHKLLIFNTNKQKSIEYTNKHLNHNITYSNLFFKIKK